MRRLAQPAPTRRTSFSDERAVAHGRPSTPRSVTQTGDEDGPARARARWRTSRSSGSARASSPTARSSTPSRRTWCSPCAAGKVLYGDAGPGGRARRRRELRVPRRVRHHRRRLCMQSARTTCGQTLAALPAANASHLSAVLLQRRPTRPLVPSCTPQPTPASGQRQRLHDVHRRSRGRRQGRRRHRRTRTTTAPTSSTPSGPWTTASRRTRTSDGVGDACDLCPLDANTTTCTVPDRRRRGRRRRSRTADNCPTSPTRIRRTPTATARATRATRAPTPPTRARGLPGDHL